MVISEEPLSLEDQGALLLKTERGEVVASPVVLISAPNHETIFFRAVQILEHLVKVARQE